jgi:hypothetical protein
MSSAADRDGLTSTCLSSPENLPTRRIGSSTDFLNVFVHSIRVFNVFIVPGMGALFCQFSQTNRY